MNVKKKSEYTEKNLNLTTKTKLYIEIATKFKAKKNLNFESGYLNFTKFQGKNLNEWQVCIIQLDHIISALDSLVISKVETTHV